MMYLPYSVEAVFMTPAFLPILPSLISISTFSVIVLSINHNSVFRRFQKSPTSFLMEAPNYRKPTVAYKHRGTPPKQDQSPGSAIDSNHRPIKDMPKHHTMKLRTPNKFRQNDASNRSTATLGFSPKGRLQNSTRHSISHPQQKRPGEASPGTSRKPGGEFVECVFNPHTSSALLCTY